MIAVLTCKCPNADTIARNFLKTHGYPDWLTIPLHRGVLASHEFLKTLPETAEGPDHLLPLEDFIGHVSKYVVILGYTDHSLAWSNIFSSSAKAQADAEIILEQFANL